MAKPPNREHSVGSMDLMRNRFSVRRAASKRQIPITGRFKVALALMLVASQSASADLDAEIEALQRQLRERQAEIKGLERNLAEMHSLEQSQSPEQHIATLDDAIAKFLWRLGNPLTFDAEDDFKKRQALWLDEKDKEEGAFLRAARQSDDDAFFIVGIEKQPNGKLRKEGYVLLPRRDEKRQAFDKTIPNRSKGLWQTVYHVVPTPREHARLSRATYPNRAAQETVIALRRELTSKVILGTIQGSAWPFTRAELRRAADRADFFQRTEVALDLIMGEYADGSPMLTEIEFTAKALNDEIFLHYPAQSDSVLRTGPFGSAATLGKASAGSGGERLAAPRRVSLLREVIGTKGPPRPTLYSPLQLTRSEAIDLLDGLRDAPDILLVDPRGDQELPLRRITLDGKKILLLNVSIWKEIVSEQNASGLLPLLKEISDVPVTGDLREVLLLASTVEIPVGTEVLRSVTPSNSPNSDLEILLRRPGHVPLAKFVSSSQVWYSRSSNEVNRATFVLSRALHEDDGPLGFTWQQDGRTYHRHVIRQEAGRPFPLFIPQGRNQPILLMLGVNWKNPFLQPENKNAYGISVDPSTGEVEAFGATQVPLTKKVSIEPPAQQTPGINEK